MPGRGEDLDLGLMAGWGEDLDLDRPDLDREEDLGLGDFRVGPSTGVSLGILRLGLGILRLVLGLGRKGLGLGCRRRSRLYWGTPPREITQRRTGIPNLPTS